MQINKSLQQQMYQRQLDCTPTFIEVGACSFQEGMPIMCESPRRGGAGGNGSSSASSNITANPHSGSSSGANGTGSKSSFNNIDMGENLIESLADAMNELPSSSNHHHYHHNHNHNHHQNNSHFYQNGSSKPHGLIAPTTSSSS